jgi:hypothetical protein
MSVRTGGSMSFVAGLMAPRKFDLILTEYTTTFITNYGYFSVAPDGTEVFQSRTEITKDSSGREIRIQLFTTQDGIFS